MKITFYFKPNFPAHFVTCIMGRLPFCLKLPVTTIYEVKSSSDRKSLYHMGTLEFDFRVGVFCTFYRFEQLFT